MREHPWHIRRPTTEHYQWFQNIIDLHAVTQSWVNDLDMERGAVPHQARQYLVQDGRGKNLLDTIRDIQVDTELDQFLDDSHPEELLSHLDRAVWAVQAWTLSMIQDKIPKGDRKVLNHALEQSSWKAGRACKKRRWGNLHDDIRNNLKGIYASIQSSPFSGFPRQSHQLIKRALPHELHMELIDFPNVVDQSVPPGVFDQLLHLLVFWLRGYVFEIQPKVRINLVHNDPKKRPQLIWQLTD